MKTRKGFVSNSSSSSFVVQKEGLTELQIHAINNHIEVANNLLDWPCKERSSDAWTVTETEDTFELYTSMDNFDIYFLLIKIGVPEDNITGGEY